MTTTFELFCKSIQHLCSKFHKILPVSLLVIEDFHCPYTSINILVHLVKLLLITFAIILAIEQKTTLTLLVFTTQICCSQVASHFYYGTVSRRATEIPMIRSDGKRCKTCRDPSRSRAVFRLIIEIKMDWHWHWFYPGFYPWTSIVLFRWFTSVAWLVLEF